MSKGVLIYRIIENMPKTKSGKIKPYKKKKK